MPTPEDGTPAFTAAALSTVKLLQFWRQAPLVWFAMAECVFHTKRMTNSFDTW
jgi:hypothetical protein